MKRNAFVMITGLLLVVLLAACTPATATPASVPPASVNPYQTHTMNAQGTGKVDLTPDIAYISIGVQTMSDNVSNAVNDNNAQATAIANSLKELGVAEKDIQTSAFSVYPQQQYDPNGQPTAMQYQVTNTVYITVRDLNSMSKLLDAVVRSGANTIYGITFDVENKDAAYTQARQLAIDSAKKNAQELAKAAGITLGDLVTMNVYQTSGPTPLTEGKGGAMAAGAQPPVAAGQMSIIFNADMTYEIK